MLKRLVTAVIGTRFTREMKGIQPIVDAIHDHEERLASLTDDQVREQTAKFRGELASRLGSLEQSLADTRAAKHACADPDERDALDRKVSQFERELKEATDAALDDLLPEAFATVREACRRLVGSKVLVTGHEMTWEMVPYDVQLIGGIVLHQGKIAEMATGEGKTLVATLPLYLNALPQRGVHLVTVNNYLARRDSQWMGHLLKWLGLTVGCLDDTQPSSPERRAAYGCDIAYGTNNEFGFDYLRDNMVPSLEHRVQRPHNYAIIDEVDSILIDEARTPLIISGPVGNEADTKYAEFNTQVLALARKQMAVVSQLLAEAEPLITSEASQYEGAVKLFQAQKGGPKNKKLMKIMQESGVQQMVQRVELDFISDRKLPAAKQTMRDVEEALYFVMDERGHSVHLTDRGVEAMSPDDPATFVVPDISEEIGRLEREGGLTVDERADKRRTLEAEYAAKSEKLHIIHKLLQAHALYEKDVEYVVQDGQVYIVDEFTGRIMAGRRWSDGLHQAIEAKEAVVVREETQTMATITIQNYFRMYDKLAGMTGTAETEETEFFQIYGLEVSVIPTNRPVRRVDRHDLIYKTRREKYNAIVEEVARQNERGLPVLVGTVSVEVSETLSKLLKRRGLKHEVLNAKLHQREAEIVATAGRAGAVTIATNMAGRGTDIKLGPGVKKCQVCGIQSKMAPFGQVAEKPDLPQDEVKKLGCYDDPPCGLVIIGTERHESRRIDRQLRGRSGRQGDPGQSSFYLSLEDDLMRLFGSDRIAKWMGDDSSGESEVITHPLVTRAIGNAQKRVELQNFQQRKRLLEYDDVMNQQREVVYGLRLFALEGGEELKAESVRMIDAAVTRFAEEQAGEDPAAWNRTELQKNLLFKYLIAAPDVENPARASTLDALTTLLKEAGKRSFHERLRTWDEQGKRYAIPNLSERLLSHVMQGVLDEKWKDHLYDLDQLRNAIGFRAWGQKDPLVEYKSEAFEMFVDLMHDIRATFTERLFKFQVEINAGPPAPPAAGQRRTTSSSTGPRQHSAASDTDMLAGGSSAPPPAPNGDGAPPAPRQPGSVNLPKPRAADAGSGAPVGRNDPCPCGSGKKYKKCHGANA